MFKLASDFLSLDFLRQQNQKNKPESQFNSLPISQITKEGKVLAIILRREFNQEGIHFLTPDDFSQQLAYKYLGKINYILASKIVQHFFNVSEEALSVFIGAKFNPFIF